MHQGAKPMDAIKEITFTHRYWIILLPLILIGADIITGWIQASVNGTWDSTKMRKGLYRKTGELLIIIVAYVIYEAIALPVDVPVFISGYVVIMEILSVLENLDQAGVPVPAWLTRRLKKAADALAEDDPVDGDDGTK
jgi:toxin secretion/phage lysis holin